MVLGLLGCSREAPVAATPVREPFEIVVVPAHLTLQAGGEGQLSAQTNDSSGQPIGGASIDFRAADPTLLRVTEQGHVTSVGPATPETRVTVVSGRLQRVVPVVVTPGPPQRVEKLAGDGQRVQAGDAPPEMLTARVLDRSGNPLGGVTLTLEPAADAFEPAAMTSAADGTVRFHVPGLTRAGTVVIFVRVPGSADAVESFQVQVEAGPPARLTFVPEASQAGSPPRVAPAVMVADSNGNPLSDVALTIDLPGTGLEPLTARTDSTGNALLSLPSEVVPEQLDVHVTDDPAVKATFTFKGSTPPAPAAQRKSK
jgi:hypothetical protein